MLDDEAKLLHAALDDERALVRSKTAEIRELHSRLRNLEVLADEAGQARLEVMPASAVQQRSKLVPTKALTGRLVLRRMSFHR